MSDKIPYAQRLHFRPGVLLQVQMSHGMFTDAGVPLARDEEDFVVFGHLKFGELVIGMGMSLCRNVPYVRALTRNGVCGIVYPTVVKVVSLGRD